MYIWYILLVIVFIMSTVGTCKDSTEKGISKYIYMVIVIGLCVFAAIRKDVGDTENYLRFIKETPESFEVLCTNIDWEGEWGFTMVIFILKKILFNNAQAVLAFFSTITIILYLYGLKKLTKLYNIAIYIFICASTIIVIMNGVRQYFVASIIFAALGLVYEKKWKSFFVLVMVLSTIHKSVLVLIPLYFVINNKAWSKSTFIIIGLGIIGYILYPVYGSFIIDCIADSKYSGYAEQLLNDKFGGNYIRVLVALVPVVISIADYKKISEKEKYYNIVFNCSVLNAVFYLLAVNCYIFARFNFYFSIFSIILLCWEFQYITKKDIKCISILMCMILYLIYYYYQVSIIWNIPYTTIFS